MENKLKHLRSFESYDSDDQVEETKPMNKKDMVSMLDADDSCEFSKDELMKMEDDELTDMCSNLNEGFLNFFVNLVNNIEKGGRGKLWLEKLPNKIKSLLRLGKKGDKRGLSKEPTADEVARVTSEADKDGYLGRVSVKEGKLIYINSRDSKSISPNTTAGA